MEVPEGAHNYTAHLFSIQAKKLTRNAEEICGIHHFAAAVTLRYPLIRYPHGGSGKSAFDNHLEGSSIKRYSEVA